MRILGNSFYFPRFLCLPAAPNWHFLSSPLLARVSQASRELLAWVQECFAFVRDLFLCLLWPETSFTKPAALRPKEAEVVPVGVLARGKGSKAASATFEALCEDPYGLYKRIKASNVNSFSSPYNLILSFLRLCPCKTGVWTNFEPMEHNLLSLSTLDPISPTHSGMVEMGSNVLKAKILHSISPKLVQTPVKRWSPR